MYRTVVVHAYQMKPFSKNSVLPRCIHLLLWRPTCTQPKHTHPTHISHRGACILAPKHHEAAVCIVQYRTSRSRDGTGGALKRRRNKTFNNCFSVPGSERSHRFERWHRGAKKNKIEKIKKTIAPRAISRTILRYMSTRFPSREVSPSMPSGGDASRT